jgi:chitodextrinase
LGLAAALDGLGIHKLKGLAVSTLLLVALLFGVLGARSVSDLVLLECCAVDLLERKQLYRFLGKMTKAQYQAWLVHILRRLQADPRPASGLVGAELTFSGSGSSDSDGAIVRYAWDFGDGATANGVKVSHVYAQAGSYQVSLRVTDDGGLSDSATLAVQIEEPVPANLPPVAVIQGPATAQVGESITFNASSSGDIDGSIVDYAWVFDDGTSGSGITVTHIYTQAGSYQVALTVTDDGGLTASDGQVIQVQEMVGGNSL